MESATCRPSLMLIGIWKDFGLLLLAGAESNKKQRRPAGGSPVGHSTLRVTPGPDLEPLVIGTGSPEAEERAS